ncbi:MAG: SET domain-containing protein [Candidatus Magasanikbacteria bacterium]|nr:SET domain-containing protein [Candidatus Magasanikbacteria bacterium]
MKYPYPRPTKYNVRVKKSASGFGLFAEDAIPKNRFIIEYWGKIISDKKADELGGKYIFGLENDKNISGAHRKNIARYINHSCQPNCEASLEGDRIFIRSLKKINPGDELTYNYGKVYFESYIKPFGCRCVKCAKKITGR